MQLDGNQPIALSLTLDKINVILGALSKMPFESVAGLITEIQQQAHGQILAAQQPASEESKTAA